MPDNQIISPSEEMLRKAKLLDDGDILYIKKSKCSIFMKTSGCTEDEIYIWQACKWKLTTCMGSII